MGAAGGDQDTVPEHGYLSAQHVAFLDLDALFFDLQRFKAERAWHNLNLSREAIPELLHDQSWYRLLIPEEELAFDSFEKVQLWQEIATALLKKYCERYYSFRKKEWELPHLEYRDLDGSDPNFPNGNEEFPDGYYRILVEESQTEIVEKLKELKALIMAGNLTPLAIRRTTGDMVRAASLRAASASCRFSRRNQPGPAERRRTSLRRGPQDLLR